MNSSFLETAYTLEGVNNTWFSVPPAVVSFSSARIQQGEQLEHIAIESTNYVKWRA